MARSRESGIALEWLRKQVAFDRLLARLIEVAPNRWMLKGALALDYRLRDRTRTSKDMDLAHEAGDPQASDDLRSATETDLGDFFHFSISRTSRLDQLPGGAAVRYHLSCRLGRSVFNDATVDVSFTDAFDIEAELIEGPALLEFADVAPVRVPALPLNLHVAQKVHAYSSRYGPGGQPSSRSKDLVDLVITADNFAFDGRQLRQALERTFEQRATHPLPEALPPPPPGWHTDYPRVARRLGVDPDVDAAHRAAAGFIDPVLRQRESAERWDPSLRAWIETKYLAR